MRQTVKKGLLGLLILALGLSACSRESALPAPPRTVLVHTVRTAAVPDALALVGEVRARHEADLSFRVGGKLVLRLVDVGAIVRPGQTLARLDPQDLRLAAQAARAQRLAAESEATTAQAERERAEGLLMKKFISRSAFDARDHAAKAAAARLEQARAQQAASDNQLSYGNLIADRAGVVTNVFAETDQIVAAGQPIVRLARLEEKEIAVAVPEGRLNALKSAQSLAISLWALPELNLRGELREIAPAADVTTRTYAARVRIINAPATVQLGMTAQVAAQRGGEETAVQVPSAAIVDRGDGPAVWVIDGEIVRRQPVIIAQFREDTVLLSAGLKDGERIVAVGAHRLAEGERIKPLPMTEKAR